VTPLLLEERYYPLVECRLVWRRMVVAFTSCKACVRDLRAKSRHLLVGHVGLPIKDQHWHINVAERLGRPQRGDRAANYGCKHLRVRPHVDIGVSKATCMFTQSSQEEF
jgi:hypothetical protein